MKYSSSTIAWLFCLVMAGVIGTLAYLAPPAHKENGVVAGVPLGGSFTLTDQNGKTVTEKSWPGQYMLVYFGFTHCPDICPVGLGKMAEALDALPAAISAKVQPIFITVDPERDTVKDLKNYVAAFHPRLVGLTGTAAQISHVEKLYRVYAQKQGKGADYMVNHSGFTYLMAPNGENLVIFAHDTPAEAMSASLAALLK